MAEPEISTVVFEQDLPLSAMDLQIRLLSISGRRLVRWHIDNLAAPFWRLYWNDAHGAEVILADCTVSLGPDALVLIPPETPCAARLHNKVGHLFLHFLTSPALDCPRLAVHEVPIGAELRSEAAELLRGLLGERNEPLRLGLLARMLVHWALPRVPAPDLRGGYSDRRIHESIEFLQTHLTRRIANDELARRVHMNTNAFIRFFREATGETPQACLARLRVERAVLLLHDPQRSIEEIAAQTGFCDRYHFTRTFRRLREMGPASFRRMIMAQMK